MTPTTQRVPRFAGDRRIEAWVRPVPAPDVGELLIRVRANALCGTDRSQYLHGSDVVPGHEAAGTVAEVGPGTTTPVGTPGVVFLMDFCGACRSCRLALTNQCLAKRADMGFTRDGGYGAYELVSESNFFPIGADLPFADATLLLDVMGTTGHALERASLVRPDVGSVVVAGAGPLGAGIVAMARIVLGPDVPVVVGDLVAERLVLVEDLGGRPVDLGASTLAEGVRSHGLPEGADVAIDTAGRGAARVGLLEALGKRGVLVCVGHGEELTLDVSRDLIAPERAVVGSEYFRYDELPGNLERLRANRDLLGRILTRRYPIEELPAALEAFFAGAPGKVVVEQ